MKKYGFLFGLAFVVGFAAIGGFYLLTKEEPSETATENQQNETSDVSDPVASAPTNASSEAKPEATLNAEKDEKADETGVAATSDVPIIIYDTDMGPDVDDAIGLAIAHAYETKGLAKIGAVTVSRNNDNGARYSDIVNTYYGRPDIPIGMTATKVPEQNDNNYWTADKGMLEKYPHDVHESSIPEGYKLMRKVLAESPDQSVIIAHVGFTTNVDQLLLSEGDEYSDLNGVDLVKKKVKSMAIMGGENIGSVTGGFNFTKYAPGTPIVFDNWPVAILQSEGPLGGGIKIPKNAFEGDSDHPVYEAYNAMVPTGKMVQHREGLRAWDPLTVMGPIEPELFNFGPEGEIVLIGDKRAHTDFKEKAGGIDRSMGWASDYSEEEKNKLIERMIELTKTPAP